MKKFQFFFFIKSRQYIIGNIENEIYVNMEKRKGGKSNESIYLNRRNKPKFN